MNEYICFFAPIHTEQCLTLRRELRYLDLDQSRWPVGGACARGVASRRRGGRHSRALVSVTSTQFDASPTRQYDSTFFVITTKHTVCGLKDMI